METQVKKIDGQSLALAKEILLCGGVVGMPTETVYGLAADGTNPTAVKEIFSVKGRPTDNPLIAHVHKDYDLTKLVEIEYDYVYTLLKKFTPGPLTVVLKNKRVVCDQATCCGETLAVRIPEHEGCQMLLRAVDKPLVAPSANLSKHTSPVTAEHVFADLNGKIPLILDGGKSSGGIESTVLDCTCYPPRILRAGLITQEMIKDVVGDCEIAFHREGDKVKSPGVKYKHYRPKCETMLFESDELEQAKFAYEKAEQDGKVPYLMCADFVAEKIDVKNKLLLGNTEKEIASNLYDKLLFGEKVADLIIAVAMPDEKGIYMGIMNRLRKSCG